LLQNNEEGDGKRFFFLGFFLSLWFSSLELTINYEMVVFLMLKVAMVKGRRLKKKGDGDLEFHKQNVASSNQAIVEQNVVSIDHAIVKQIVISSNQAIAKQIVASLEMRIEN
jgi:hypothetical protein